MLPRSLLRWALIAAGLYLAYAAVVFALQRELVFPGRRRGSKPVLPRLAAGVERVWLAPDHGPVEAFYLPPPEGAPHPAPALLFAHGNGELIDHWLEPFERLQARGLGVLLVEYPGYGRSLGSPTEASVQAAMLAGHDWLSARPELDRARIVGFGRSLGGGAIGTVLGKRPLAALVLTSTFTGVASFAAGFFVPGFLARDRFDTLAAVRSYDGPVLIAHGERDSVVPFAHGQELARASARATLIRYDADHNDCPPDWGEFVGEVSAFLRGQGVLRE